MSCSSGGDAHRAGGIPDRRICPEPPYIDIFINRKAVFIVREALVIF